MVLIYCWPMEVLRESVLFYLDFVLFDSFNSTLDYSVVSTLHCLRIPLFYSVLFSFCFYVESTLNSAICI